MEKPIGYKEVIEFIFDQINAEQSDEVILHGLKNKFTITEDTAEWAIEMARTGYFRAHLKNAGKSYPKSNIDNDPFLQHSMQLAQLQLKNGND